MNPGLIWLIVVGVTVLVLFIGFKIDDYLSSPERRACKAACDKLKSEKRGENVAKDLQAYFEGENKNERWFGLPVYQKHFESTLNQMISKTIALHEEEKAFKEEYARKEKFEARQKRKKGAKSKAKKS